MSAAAMHGMVQGLSSLTQQQQQQQLQHQQPQCRPQSRQQEQQQQAQQGLQGWRAPPQDEYNYREAVPYRAGASLQPVQQQAGPCGVAFYDSPLGSVTGFGMAQDALESSNAAGMGDSSNPPPDSGAWHGDLTRKASRL